MGDLCPEPEVIDAVRPRIRPRTIDRYIIERELGVGGMGVVYLATDPELKRSVVIKLLRPDIADGGLHHRARLVREAQAMAQVSHPNVVPIYDVGLHDEQVFLAMEFIDGCDLAKWLRSPKRSIAEVIEVFVAAGRGLAAAHRVGLVHRDFKPHNVMIAKTGEVKVTDFGLARAELAAPGKRRPLRDHVRMRQADSDLGAATLLDSPITRTGAVVGTPAYMAPEQILGEFVDARSDQFSFCVAFYEALYEQRPFKGETVQELFDSTLEGTLSETVGRRVPAIVRAALRRGLAVEPDERFASMDELLAAFTPSTARRRAMIAGALAGAALLSTGAVVALRGGEPSALCTGGDAELATVWSPKRERSLEIAFLATKQGPARASFTVASKAIGMYAESWLAAHRDACEATQVRGDQPPDIMGLRMKCLRQRRTELDAVLDLLGKPDPAMITDAGNIVARLPSPLVCANALVLAMPPLPGDPLLRTEIEETEADMARAHALLVAQRTDDARVAMTAALVRGERTGYQPLVAELHFQLALVAEQGQDAVAVERHLVSANEIADRAGVDRIRANTAIHLVEMETRAGKRDDAERWVRQARATIDRLGKGRDLLGQLELAYGDLQLARGDEAGAIASHDRAIEHLAAAFGASSEPVAYARIELGKLHMASRRWELAFAELERAREIYRELHGPSSLNVAQITSHMALIRTSEQKHAEAVELGDEQLAIFGTYFGPDDPVVVGMAVSHAYGLQGVGRTGEAIALLEKAMRVLATRGDASIGGAAQTLAYVYIKSDQLPKAYETLEASLHRFRKQYGGADHLDVVTTLNAMGVVRHKQKDYDKAIALFEQAREIVARIQEPGSMTMADTLTRIGAAEIERHRPAEAAVLLEQAHAMRVAGKAPAGESSWTKYELGRAWWDAKHDRARAVALVRESEVDAKAANDLEQLAKITAWLAGK